MTRTRFANRCPICREVIQETASGRECACREWPFESVERGTVEEEEYLRAFGFRFAVDPSGDMYYWRPGGYLLHLYGNDSWDCDKAPTDCRYLEEYLALFQA